VEELYPIIFNVILLKLPLEYPLNFGETFTIFILLIFVLVYKIVPFTVRFIFETANLDLSCEKVFPSSLI